MTQENPYRFNDQRREFLQKNAHLLDYYLNFRRTSGNDEERDRLQDLFSKEAWNVLSSINQRWLNGTVSMAVSMLKSIPNYLTSVQKTDFEDEKQMRLSQIIDYVHNTETLPASSNNFVNSESIEGWIRLVYLIGWQGGYGTKEFAPEILDKLVESNTIYLDPFTDFEKRTLSLVVIRTILDNASDAARMKPEGNKPGFLSFMENVTQIDALDDLDRPYIQDAENSE